MQLFSGTVSSLDRFGAGVMADEGERFKVIATVPTGLEQSAAEECSETIGSGVASAQRGSISCTLERVEDLRKVLTHTHTDTRKNYRILCKQSSQFPAHFLLIQSSFSSCSLTS